MVVDNASSSGQARPLLHSDGVTAALMTSRHTLDGLDARLHDLGPLDEAASVTLLDRALRHSCFVSAFVGWISAERQRHTIQCCCTSICPSTHGKRR